MKKIAALIIILGMALLAIGCGKPETASNKEKTSPVSPARLESRNSVNSKTDSGRYAGRADSNFIEIKISGVPDEKASRVFQLSDELKTNFDKLSIKTNDVIKFEYYDRPGENPVITKIQSL
ncbi:MAG: hypothetical protein ACM3PP_06185 [Candidatus Saccharibacteria bacterium]